MNLKEAFRFQNKLQQFVEAAQHILLEDANILTVETTLLHSKAMPEAEDEVRRAQAPSEFGEQITEIVAFLGYLIAEQETLAVAIRKTKNALPVDIDSQTSLNSKRQRAAEVLSLMTAQRSREELIAGAGTGYRFNAEGNQVGYRCDVKKVTTINFDRNKVLALQRALSRKADAVSEELDRQLVNATVDYTPSFDVNDRFAEAFEAYLAKTQA